MCGICGIWASDDASRQNRSAVEAMTARLAHRGPDDSGTFLDEANGLALGFRRLSIIDLSAAGHQPMPNEDRSLWLIFNGEIYNFAPLRSALEKAGHHFSSRTDSEVILHGYEEWGLDVVTRLAGMFGLALWDATRRRLVLARDRLGIKPLFYYRDAQRFVFGSEIKAILAAPGIDRAVDRRAIYDYLTYNYIPCPRTVYQHIRKLPAGHMLIVDRDGEQLRSYWDVSLEPRGAPSEAEAVHQVQEGFQSAVRSHLVADVPVGVFLSGGMDSSAIAVEMAAAARDPIHTFSVGFDVRERSELPYARAVAEQIKSDHHEEVLSWPDAQSQLACVTAVYDEPFADSSSVPTMAVSRLARHTVTVALSGEGGDEVFAGYDTYPAWASRMRWRSLVPAAFRSIVTQVGRHWALPRGQGIARQLEDLNRSPLEQFARLMEWVSGDERQAVIAPEVARDLGGDDYWYFRQYWREDADAITRLQYVDLKTYLADDLLVKVDRASMAVSLEARVPMLDHQLVETVFAIPGDLRFRNGVTKYLERRAMADRLPASSLNRSKMGFTPPLHQWLSPANSEWARRFMDRGAAVELGLLRPHAIDLLSPRPTWLWASKVWVLLVLESWAKQERAALAGR